MGNVFANMREVSAKKDGNKSICAMMSVCLSPPSPPAGPIPIPYPVTDMASNTVNGTGSVFIQGKEVGKQNGSDYKKCNGNEPATRSFGMDVVSHTIQGKTKFEMYSFDVLFEGKGAERLLDLTSTNHMNPATAFTASVAGGAPPGPPNSDDCAALEARNAEFRNRERDDDPNPDGTPRRNDEVAINSSGTTFQQAGTVTSGAYVPAGGSAGAGYTGTSATNALANAKNNALSAPTTTPARTAHVYERDGRRHRLDAQGNKIRKTKADGSFYADTVTHYRFPFCPDEPYDHPGGGLHAHAELNILNDIGSSAQASGRTLTKDDRVLLKIDWNHQTRGNPPGQISGDDRPCSNCQNAIEAACKCMTIIICDAENEPVDRCEEPYERKKGTKRKADDSARPGKKPKPTSLDG
ncbi:DUF4150 domain-containing protein [Citreicella sp. C3M06]|uniref:DUF4150 domain-containing protein n=1 Tax=Citreicella sp. C3M06 TaxID=2841564 RepID=UPI001C0A1317|nr:DUF4150 domain-containing protein [Citreicella sp. C3M06]MBU2959872.1 DUF4150 domain-containing protein [Citreicella sp. C3M06]